MRNSFNLEINYECTRSLNYQDNVLYVLYFIILYILIFTETFAISSGKSPVTTIFPFYHSQSLLHQYFSYFTVRCITLNSSIYFSILKCIINLRIRKVHSILIFLSKGTKSMKSFVITSISLYTTILNITLIIINNCYLLNPGPQNANEISVFYQNVQGLITYGSLGSVDPTMNITKLTELNVFVANYSPDIIVLNETWLKESVKNSELFSNKDYKIFRLDRNLLSHPPHPTDPKKLDVMEVEF